MDPYKECAHIPRLQPPADEPNPDISEEIARTIRTLPTFENTLFNLKYIKHYSMETNELLNCRWQKYKDGISTKVFTPFQFPDHKDLHFHNGYVQLIKGYRSGPFNKKDIYGPGVDDKGQMPIPFERFMQRGTVKKSNKKERKKPKKSDKNDSKTDDEDNKAGQQTEKS